jgi:hypothetical protein
MNNVIKMNSKLKNFSFENIENLNLRINSLS